MLLHYKYSCPRRFDTDKYLLKHKHSHSNKTFRCGYNNCNQIFSSHNELADHKLHGHQFICPNCAKSYANEASLNEHKKRVHSLPVQPKRGHNKRDKFLNQ